MAFVYLMILSIVFWMGFIIPIKLWLSKCVFQLVEKRDLFTLDFNGKSNVIVAMNQNKILNGHGKTNVMTDAPQIWHRYVEDWIQCLFILFRKSLMVYAFSIILQSVLWVKFSWAAAKIWQSKIVKKCVKVCFKGRSTSTWKSKRSRLRFPLMQNFFEKSLADREKIKTAEFR